MAQTHNVPKKTAKTAAKAPPKTSSAKKSGKKAGATKRTAKLSNAQRPPTKKAVTKRAETKKPTSPKVAVSKPDTTKRVSLPQPQTKTSPNTQHPHTQALLELRAFGLSYPETHLKSPWPDHLDLAVRDKTFAYLSIEGQPLHVSCKLPESCQAALDLEFTEPTGYGLGKSGWVTATFNDSDEPPVEFLKTWLDESYRAQAPKSLSKKLPKMTSD